MNQFKNIEKIKPENLLSLMLEVLEKYDNFIHISGVQPFLMSFDAIKYYVYVKNISSAYFSDRDNTTRAQLPVKSEFDLIKKSSHPFVFLGYDGVNDVFVCWNYHIAKERLNVGKSVSFYSRTFFQSEVKEGDFARRNLKNGDSPVFFKRSSLIDFFKKIDTFFPIKTSEQFDFSENIGDYNYAIKFENYLRDIKKLSEKSIKNYVNALNGQISKGIAEYFIPNLKTIFYINNLSVLEELNVQLFKKEEYKNLNIKGKNMYSCAFDNYISFTHSHKDYKVKEDYVEVSDFKIELTQNVKLLKILDNDLINEIKPYLSSNRILSAVQIVGKYYEGQYPNMELAEWFALVENIKGDV